MSTLALKLGALKADGFVIRRSGVHWLVEDGHLCRPNEVIAYCNIALDRTSAADRSIGLPFADERDLQVAFAPRVSGRIRRPDGSTLGGYLNVLGVRPWDTADVLATLEEVSDDDAARGGAETLELLLLAGRRATELADIGGGILPGWHNRARAWWWRGDASLRTVLSLGLCDATGVVRGDELGFFEMFEASDQSVQMVFVPDNPLVPCAPILTERFLRTPAQEKAIAEDLRAALALGQAAPTAADWLFAGAFLEAIQRSPIQDGYEVLGPEGLSRQPPPSLVILSLYSEPNSILVHKKLGYSVHILRHHQQAAGPAIQKWLSSAFDVVKRSPEAIRKDYARLFETARKSTNARFAILNRMSTSGSEDIFSYAAFDAPMGDTLANVASKELNLVLHELEDSHGVSIIDVDALATEIGASEHLPDGVHQSATLQAVLRREILSCLDVGRYASAAE